MSKNRIDVLFLDDEENNLISFKSAFRRDYRVHVALTAREAREILDQTEIPIVISDQRMPDTTGVEFFQSIIDTYPDCIRILLTGYTDIKAVIDAINKGHVYRYLTKPWDEQEIRIAIENGFSYYNAKKELREKNRKLQKTNDELNRFVYSASHDLRAPLTSIMGVLNLARLEVGDFGDDPYLPLIDRSVKRLDEFIQNIIDYYQNIRSDTIRNEVDFNTVVKGIIEDLGMLSGKNIDFRVNISQPGSFLGDSFRIKTVLVNIISNAIKYQRPEADSQVVSIDIDVLADKAVIRISDNGIGIEAEYVDKIFDMFFRATQKNSGSGIGLFIVKEALDKMGGQIDVKSAVGEGTTFSIEIPNQV